MSNPIRLLAKSYDKRFYPVSPPDFALLTQHSRDVAEACRTLLDIIGDLCLYNADLLSPSLASKLSVALRAAGWLQDLGKANSHFQQMVNGNIQMRQLLRHEVLSAILAWQLPQLRQWLGKLPKDVLVFAVWGALAHHRKFDRFSRANNVLPATVFLGHEDLQTILIEMASDLHLPTPPTFQRDLEISFDGTTGTHCDLQGCKSLKDLQDEFADMEDNYKDVHTRRFVALIKALGIGADVAASAIAARGQHASHYSVSKFIRETLGHTGMTAADFIGLLHRRVGVPCYHFNSEQSCVLSEFSFRPFQIQTSESPSTLTLVRAGCGAGKSLCAYLWGLRWCRAAEQSGRRNFRFFFCLPTTGTATEHYKDYALEAGVDSTLTHSRASIDLASMAVTAEQEEAESDDPGNFAGVAMKSNQEKIESLALWSTPLVVATVDTVLGLMANARKSIYTLPALMAGVVVFDEVHAFDDRLFGHLLSFVCNFPNLPVLLMTASLPEERKRALQTTRPDLVVIDGPEEFEVLERYMITNADTVTTAWVAVDECLSSGGKVLWVRNRVDWANVTYAECKRRYSDQVSIDLYHSRFRYIDRSARHRRVIDRFKVRSQPCVLVATQVAEMSLDLSADLLLTDLAPIPALIQRMGRVNRYSTPDNPTAPARVIVIPVPNGQELPYARKELEAAERWSERLAGQSRALNQRDLSETFVMFSTHKSVDLNRKQEEAIFFSRVWEMRPGLTREEGYTVTVVLERDLLTWRSAGGRGDPPRRWLQEREISIPLKDAVFQWDRVGFLPVAPSSQVSYDYDPISGEGTGASWL